MTGSAPDHAGLQALAEAAGRVLRRSYNLIASLRLLAFIGLAVGAAASVQAPGPLALGTVLGSGVAFFVLALWHGGVDDRLRRAEALADFHRRGHERLQGRWNHGQDDGSKRVAADHPYAADLDLVGPGGMYALLDSGAGEEGRARLAEWLFAGDGDFSESAQRAVTVRTLAVEHAWRAELAVAAVRHRGRRLAADSLPAWLESRGAPDWRRWLPLIWCARVAVLALVIWAAVMLSVETALLLVLMAAILGWGLDHLAVRRACADPDAARRHAQAAADALAVLAQAPGGAHPQLEHLRRAAASGAAAFQSLATILDAHAKRANALRALLGATLLLEWRNLDRLWRWADRHAADRSGWLAVLGEGQALACLATYAAEQGGVWAELATSGPAIETEALAHPLLPSQQRVGNTLRIELGQVLLLTGANASGKSTFLRALCLAVVLARLGLPVPAQSCRLRPLRLATVMRVADDLRGGRSRFQAEVERLKGMLDRMAPDSARAPLCLALDEILGGTNSRERHLGTQAVLDFARDGDGLVLVSTHDLDLARLAATEPQRYVLAHFADRAALGETSGDMVFDYQLRPGVLQSTNALRVMKAYGLPVRLDQPPGAATTG